MQWRDYTTLPSRGLSLRPVGKSSECFRMTAGVKSGKLRMSACFPVCPRKRTYLPILELLPPPVLSERGQQASPKSADVVAVAVKYALPQFVGIARDARRAANGHAAERPGQHLRHEQAREREPAAPSVQGRIGHFQS